MNLSIAITQTHNMQGGVHEYRLEIAAVALFIVGVSSKVIDTVYTAVTSVSPL